MELNTMNNDKHEENKSDYLSLPNEKKRDDAISAIFNTHPSDHEFFDRAGENSSNVDNKINGLDDFSARNNFDIRSDFGGPLSESLPDVNMYQNKKTVAQGMMDLALFSANANQLRYVLESNSHPYYYPGIVLISISLFFQVAVGVGLLLNTRYNVKSRKEICIANKINNFTIIGIFLVTVVNVFISAFGVASGGSTPAVTVFNRFGEEDFENMTTMAPGSEDIYSSM